MDRRKIQRTTKKTSPPALEKTLTAPAFGYTGMR